MKPVDSQAEIQQAQRIWDAALPATERHPILMLRGIQVPGLRLDDSGSLLMPLRDAERKIQNVGFIRLVGKMQFLHDFFRGAYFGIEGERDVIYVVRGLSRGACYYRSTGNSVAVVVDEESVERVAPVMRHRYPHAKIVTATDIDGAAGRTPLITQAEVAPAATNGPGSPPKRASSSASFDSDLAVPLEQSKVDAEVERDSANADAQVAEASGDSAVAPRLAGEDAADERSDAPQAPTGPVEGALQAPTPCGANDAIVLLEPESEEAQLLLSWIRRKGLTELTRKQVMQFGPNSSRYAPLAKLALRGLVRSGWLSTDDDSRYVLTPAASVAISEERQRSA
jgi:hypothetical protein